MESKPPFHAGDEQSSNAPTTTDATSLDPFQLREAPPFSRWWPVLAGALAGIALRLVFSGKPGGAYSAMAGSFIHFAPLAVGAITVYIAERTHRRTWGYYIWQPMLATGLFVIGTLLILIEGLICAIIIVPYFALSGALGGLMMGIICRATKWPKQTVYCFALLPLISAVLPIEQSPRNDISSIQRTISIQAPATQVWQHIHNVQNIQPEEVSAGWLYRIGVPLPIAGVSDSSGTESVRKIAMGKDIRFEQVVADWREDEYVRWTYRFAPDSFPPRALDDHVKIGGHYFDMIDTSYALTAMDNQTTALTIRMTYRVSTDFNWYANRVAHFLIANFEETILNFYKARAETGTAASVQQH